MDTSNSAFLRFYLQHSLNVEINLRLNFPVDIHENSEI